MNAADYNDSSTRAAASAAVSTGMAPMRICPVPVWVVAEPSLNQTAREAEVLSVDCPPPTVMAVPADPLTDQSGLLKAVWFVGSP
jgi:hypothetical protein